MPAKLDILRIYKAFMDTARHNVTYHVKQYIMTSISTQERETWIDVGEKRRWAMRNEIYE